MATTSERSPMSSTRPLSTVTFWKTDSSASSTVAAKKGMGMVTS